MKQNCKRSILLSAVLVCVLIMCALLVGATTTNFAVKAEDNSIVNMSFDGAGVPKGWENLVSEAEGGSALLLQNFREIPVDKSKLYESNNYEVSFDIKADQAFENDVFYFHFIGLNGDTGENIYFKANNNGMYWCITPFEYHPIYNNSGDMHGGRDYSAVNLTEKHNVKFVHFDGYMELWIDGTCRAVSHLSHFGNNNYDTRTVITEGKITGFAFDARTNLRISNLVIKEAVGHDTEFKVENKNVSASASEILPYTAQNLYKGNFRIEGKYSFDNAELANYYPNITVLGLNNGNGNDKNQTHYGVAFQAYVDRLHVTPQIFAQKPDASWAGASATEATLCNVNDGVSFVIEVFGDNMKYYINGKLAVKTSFTELGIKKGYAQYIRVQSGFGGMVWNEISYKGFDAETGAIVVADKNRIKNNETATFTAIKFGADTAEAFDWYVDGVKQAESGMELTISGLDAGKHSIKYASESFSSDEVYIEVYKDIITIEVDKEELYKTESISITATLSGDFESDVPVWYVDGVAYEEESSTLVLTALNEGEHKVVYKNESTTSNEISFTILSSQLIIETEKNNFRVDETAVITAVTKGVDATANYVWKVNNVEQAEKGAVFSVSLSAYKRGDVLSVTCEVDGLQAETTLNIFFDPLAEIKEDKNYKVFNAIELKASESYGNFACVEEDGENCLISAEANTSSWYTLTGEIPESMYFAVSFDFYVPETITQTNYVYPGFTGLNKNYPQGFVEIAITVSPEGFSPYIKDQADGNRIYAVDDYGFGVDLSFNGEVAKKGAWNKVSYVVHGKYLAVYINDVQVYFVNYPNMMLPSSIGFNTYPDGGSGMPFVKFRNIVVSGIVEEAPGITSVACAISNTKINIGEVVTITANINPYDATYATIEWYVNAEKVDGENELKYEFAPEAVGEYSIYCKVDGIQSNTKTVNVMFEESKTKDEGKKGCMGAGSVDGLAIFGIYAAAAVLLIKRKTCK